jgi:hypothetical protein
MTVGVVWRARVFFGAGMAMMGSAVVTTLQPRGLGDLELTPAHEAALFLSENSSREVR